MKDSVVFITGGASGLGKAIAFQFAEAGYKVCIGDLNDERGAETEHELKQIHGNILYRRCDVTRIRDLEAVRDELVALWGRVDVVVNNAGVAGVAGPIEDVSIQDWEWVLDINVLGVVRGSKVFTPLFKSQQRGHFVNIASAAGLLSAPMMSNYNVSKAAVVSLSETLSCELSADGIGVSVACPAFFKTNLVESMRSHIGGLQGKVNRLMEKSGITAEDVAKAIYKAVEDNEFWVVTHPAERRLWYLKRFWHGGYQKVMQHQAHKLFKR